MDLQELVQRNPGQKEASCSGTGASGRNAGCVGLRRPEPDADGRSLDEEFFPAPPSIEFMGEITSGRVIFGPDDAEPLLGVTALESVGILVDPANRTLKRMPAIPLKSAAMEWPSRHTD